MIVIIFIILYFFVRLSEYLNIRSVSEDVFKDNEFKSQ